MMLVTAFLSEVKIYNKSIDNIDIMEYNRRIHLERSGHGDEEPDVYVSDVHASAGVHALFAYMNGNDR